MQHCLLSFALLIFLLGSPVNAAEKATGGFDHLGLSVSDLEASTNFFLNVLEFDVAGRDSKYPAVFMNNGEMTLTLWEISDQAVEFDRKRNVGLHHLAIGVPSFKALDDLYEKIRKTPNIVIEFAPELAYGGPAKHMMIREPSGNRIELVHRPVVLD